MLDRRNLLAGLAAGSASLTAASAAAAALTPASTAAADPVWPRSGLASGIGGD